MSVDRIAPPRQLLERGIVVIVRAAQPDRIAAVAEALSSAGIGCLEVTMNTPGALETVSEIRRRLPGLAVGVGTVMTPDEVRQASDAGAQFVVSPHTDPDVIACAAELGLPSVPGAFTPTEIVTAWRAGASAVKVFPASLGGPDYVRQVRGPLPEVALLPTGGIGLDDIGGYVAAGAIGVGLGGAVLGDALSGGDLDRLVERAARARDAVAHARAGST